MLPAGRMWWLATLSLLATGEHGECRNSGDPAINKVVAGLDSEVERLSGMEKELVQVQDAAAQDWTWLGRDKTLHSYHISKGVLTYSQATRYCRNKGGHLARVKGATEMSRILDSGVLTKGRHCDALAGGYSYRGNLSRTIGGYQCQRWDSQTPHTHTTFPRKNPYFPGEPDSKAKNYCRRPDEPRPWCYTTNPKVRWQFCDVKLCAAVFIGADSLARKGVWKWNDGTPLSKNSELWSAGQPDSHHHQRCASIWAYLTVGFLDSLGCESKSYALCERTTSG